jgi:hypothetical protein
MTNRELITSALRMLGVLDADQSASAEDAALGLEQLNDMMLDLAGEGVDLGFPPQDNVSDDFPLDDTEAAAVKPLLAMQLFTYYPSARLPPTLPATAEANKLRLLRDAVLSNMEEADMSNLPGGEGKYYRGDIINGD